VTTHFDSPKFFAPPLEIVVASRAGFIGSTPVLYGFIGSTPVLYGRCFYRMPSPLEVDCSPLEIDVYRVGFIGLPVLFSMDIVSIGWGMVEVIAEEIDMAA